jgi:hypothetical protein
MNHPNRSSINAQEAGAFVTHCMMDGLSTAEALQRLSRTTWDDLLEDLAFGRKRHTATIRRLAKPGVLEIDARNARNAAYRNELEVDKAHWIALSDAHKTVIRLAVADAGGKNSNKAARNVATALGISIHANSIDTLRQLIDPRQPWNV